MKPLMHYMHPKYGLCTPHDVKRDNNGEITEIILIIEDTAHDKKENIPLHLRSSHMEWW